MSKTPKTQKKTPDFNENLKPTCWSCLRRNYGVLKESGWWCGNCEEWIVMRRPRSGRRQ